jgi:hypothetical protein
VSREFLAPSMQAPAVGNAARREGMCRRCSLPGVVYTFTLQEKEFQGPPLCFGCAQLVLYVLGAAHDALRSHP